MFLPAATAMAETGMVSFTRLAYTRLVVARRPQIPGDMSRFVMPVMVFAAHGLSESVRLSALLSGAARTGSFSWISSAALGFALNALTRLGWLRHAFFCCTRCVFGAQWAIWIAAPNGFSKLHDEFKIYGGYIRFVAPCSLIIARAIYYRELSWSGPVAPAFNAATAGVFVTLFVLEVLEDVFVLQELLPAAPIPTEVLETNLPRNNSDAGALVSVEMRPNQAKDSSWRGQELSPSGSKKLSPVMTNQFSDLSSVQPQASLGTRRVSWGSRLRRQLGQEREVVPSMFLHGLREISFLEQLGCCAIACMFTLAWLELTLGPSKARGFCPSSSALDPMDLLWRPVPMAC